MGFIGVDRRGVLAEPFHERLRPRHSPVEPHTVHSVVLGFARHPHTHLSSLIECSRCASQRKDPVEIELLAGAAPRKIIVVPERLVSIVV
jgi:hypothetical protein